MKYPIYCVASSTLAIFGTSARIIASLGARVYSGCGATACHLGARAHISASIACAPPPPPKLQPSSGEHVDTISRLKQASVIRAV
jgi:hypothetical protein